MSFLRGDMIMKKMTKCLLSATVATGILLGSTITALEPQQTKASDINTDYL